MRVENAHVPTKGLNELWVDSPAGEGTLRTMLRAVDDCAEYGVDTLVTHLTNGQNPPYVSGVGSARVERLVKRAQARKVHLAFENLRVPQHLRYVLDTFDGETVGLCWDTGHEYCWTPRQDWLANYAGRVFAVHLHDNDGTADAPMLPFEGSIEWRRSWRPRPTGAPLRWRPRYRLAVRAKSCAPFWRGHMPAAGSWRNCLWTHDSKQPQGISLRPSLSKNLSAFCDKPFVQMPRHLRETLSSGEQQLRVAFQRLARMSLGGGYYLS